MLLFYFLLYFGLISIPLLLFIFVVFGLIGDFLGAPFVPTSGKIIDEILRHAKLKKGQMFLELGSGDGRVVRSAVKEYGVNGIGIEIHPMLIFYSRLLSKLQKLSQIQFIRTNFFDFDFKKADVIFMFLLPRSVKKLSSKLEREGKKGVLIISHGFEIKEFKPFMLYKIKRTLFPTYYYKLK